MHKLSKYYYDNRQKIWKIILFVAIIICILQVLNYFAKKENDEMLSNNNNNISVKDDSIFVSNTSSVTGGVLSSSDMENVENVINAFVNYCNNGEIQKAYDLLSEDCKDKMYSTVEEFANKYYIEIFKTNKIITIENWYGDTYKVRYVDDLLSKGTNDLGEEKQDYITIIEENNQKKLNINNYIENVKVNKSTNSNNIEISVINKEIFMDYEIYNIEVTNNSENTIMLDPLTSTKTIFLKDDNDIRYVSYSHELLQNDLKIKSGITRTIGIKFTNSYSSTTKIKSLTFARLVLDYEEYSKNGNKEYIKEITVEL